MTIRNRLSVAAIGLSAMAAPLAGNAAEFINVLTGGTSGVYYPMGVALSKIYTEALPDAKVQVQSTKASVENLNLLQQGKGEVGFSLGDSVKMAAEGNADAGFAAPLDKLRGIAAIYPNYIQIVASADSGIKTLADLKGKSVSVGAPKSGTELNARAILEAAGMTYDDLGKVEYLPFAESVELMKNRQLEATLQSSGLGNAAIKDLASSQAISCAVEASRLSTWSSTAGSVMRFFSSRRPRKKARSSSVTVRPPASGASSACAAGRASSSRVWLRASWAAQ